MAERLTVKELMREQRFTDELELVEFYLHKDTVHAVCSDGCEVEPDGECEHGFPSVLLELGYM